MNRELRHYGVVMTRGTYMSRAARYWDHWKRLAGCLLLIACIAVASCRMKQAPATPSIQITRVPPAGPGGPEQLAPIEGKVAGNVAGRQIVLYAKNGVWWVQPLRNQPFTAEQTDFTWKNTTPGCSYGTGTD